MRQEKKDYLMQQIEQALRYFGSLVRVGVMIAGNRRTQASAAEFWGQSATDFGEEKPIQSRTCRSLEQNFGF